MKGQRLERHLAGLALKEAASVMRARKFPSSPGDMRISEELALCILSSLLLGLGKWGPGSQKSLEAP